MMHMLDSRQPGFDAALRQLLAFETAQDPAVDAAVADIIASVQSRGDAALIDYTARFDRLSVTDASQLELSQAELDAAAGPTITSGGLGGAEAGADHGHVQIYLRKTSPASGPAGYELRIATPFSHRSELASETKAAYQLIGLIASGLAFDGAPVFVHVCTSLLRPLLVLRPQLG